MKIYLKPHALPPPLTFEPSFLSIVLMSHRKSYSLGSIPFSWEDKPGVCKTPNNDCPLNKGSLQAINQKSSSKLPPSHVEIQDKKIPLPPGRSTSGKGFFRLQEDPFLVAYKECTKSEKNCKLQGKKSEKNCKLQGKNKKGVGSNFSLLRSKGIFTFTCRGASDVTDDNYLKLSKLPRLPAVRDRSLTFEVEQKRGFNYESWI